ncbi:MAG: M67 family metallopeptidase [Thermoplasmata archaeon]
MIDATWRLAASALTAIQAHSRAAYPEECCGFLFAPTSEADVDRRHIRQVVPTPNQAPSDRNRRYVIDPRELVRVERSAAPSDRLVGIYHSHPDHPAVPSEFDRERAWPWYSYLILSVSRGRDPTVRAFEWDPPSLEFYPRRLRIYGGPPSGGPGDREDGLKNR